MHNYTTGEVAKICNVSVRCIQYYDSRDILIPSSLSEGGRRLYSEEDVKKLKIICFLRNNGLSINTIKELMKEENNMEVISLLLKQQQEQLQTEISQKKQQLETLQLLSNEMNHMEQISLQSIQDARIIMKNKKDLNK